MRSSALPPYGSPAQIDAAAGTVHTEIAIPADAKRTAYNLVMYLPAPGSVISTEEPPTIAPGDEGVTWLQYGSFSFVVSEPRPPTVELKVRESVAALGAKRWRACHFPSSKPCLLSGYCCWQAAFSCCCVYRLPVRQSDEAKAFLLFNCNDPMYEPEVQGPTSPMPELLHV